MHEREETNRLRKVRGRKEWDTREEGWKKGKKETERKRDGRKGRKGQKKEGWKEEKEQEKHRGREEMNGK